MRFKLLIFLLAAALTVSAGPISGTISVDLSGPSYLGTAHVIETNAGAIGMPGVDADEYQYGIPTRHLGATEGSFGKTTDLGFGTDFVASTIYYVNSGVLVVDTDAGDTTPVNLQITMNFDQPAGLSPTPYSFTVPIVNVVGKKNPDKVNLPDTSGWSQQITLGDWTYTLTAVGFVNHAISGSGSHLDPTASGSTLFVPEGKTGAADLMVRVDATAPEPATTTLFVLGLGVLVVARKFRRAL